MLLGDVSALRVRAELDERDLVKVRVGQRVVVRADAFRGREFDGKVASIDQVVGPGRINARTFIPAANNSLIKLPPTKPLPPVTKARKLLVVRLVPIGN